MINSNVLIIYVLKIFTTDYVLEVAFEDFFIVKLALIVFSILKFAYQIVLKISKSDVTSISLSSLTKTVLLINV